MVNYRDPAVVAQDTLALSKLWHVVAGLYFWEFVTTLDYEWSVIQRRRQYRWTIWIYVTTRIATLMAVILCIISVNDTPQINCEVETIFQLIFGYLSIAAASLLIVLRILAIWNKQRVVVAIATGVWGINVIFLILAIVRVRGEWVSAMATCVAANIHVTKLNLIVTPVTDIILLLIMFIGLLHLGFHERSAFGLGRLLWRQGLIWLLVATIAEVLPSVFICLNLNTPFNVMFQIPSMVTLSIAATRIHRGLVDYASGCTEHLSDPDGIQASGRIKWKANRVPFTPTPEGRLCEKPTRQPGLNDDVENDVGSLTKV
jgi:hypothetical protein